MESKNIFITSVLVLGYWTCILLGSASSAKELFRESSCGDELLTLDCGNRSVIAIYKAYFTRNMVEVANLTCEPPELDPNVTADANTEDDDIIRNSSNHCHEDLRIPINRRCSGMNQCNYSHTEEGERNCVSSGGAVIVHYDCVRESKLDKYCNTRLHFKEGYISSPGYPSYYPQLSNCNWTIVAADGEIVVLQFLHVNMRPSRVTPQEDPQPLGIMAALRPLIYHCDDDVLTILQGGTKKTLICGEDMEGLQTIEVAANKGVVVQFTSREFFPGSGFLLRYKVKGCPTLPAPADGHMVYRNGSEALYVCHKGLVFNDTLESRRILQCVDQHRWNDTSLSPCIDAEEAMKHVVYLNHTLQELKSMDGAGLEQENMTNDEAPAMPVRELEETFIEDIIVPSVLMIVLVVGTIIVVIIIFIVRRKQKTKPDEFDDIMNSQKSQPLMQAATEV